MCVKCLIVKPEGRRSLEGARSRWKYNIRTDLRETGWEGVGLKHVAQDREQWRAVLSTVMNILVVQKTGNFLTS
jgi:hypothetical protein